MTAEPPAVSVRVEHAGAGFSVAFHSALSPGAPQVLPIVDRGSVAEARDRLKLGLTRIKDLITALDVHADVLPAVAEELGSTARQVLLVLFGPHGARLLTAFWQEAFPDWASGRRVPVVECVGDVTGLLPLEFLPVFDLHALAVPVTGHADFVERCRSLIGFACVVRRAVLVRTPSDGRGEVRPLDGRVLVRYLHDGSLPGSGVERAWFEDAVGWVELRGPHPGESETPKEVARAITRAGESGRGDHVQHFSCHCDTTGDSALRYELSLRGEGGSVRLTLGELGEAFMLGDDREDAPLPLVFLNACGSSTVDPKTSLSFPQLFLENGNRGFLGTEIAIPDEEAAAFAVAFYRSFLVEGVGFGRSVHRARETLLHRHGNPLGLAYSAYGNTDLAVVRE
ncbi:CHAT domain-containing protein [Actinosynnema pretiosum]|nr:CHAT domain-containing protein [Actinosynnema pretiosum]